MFSSDLAVRVRPPVAPQLPTETILTRPINQQELSTQRCIDKLQVAAQVSTPADIIFSYLNDVGNEVQSCISHDLTKHVLWKPEYRVFLSKDLSSNIFLYLDRRSGWRFLLTCRDFIRWSLCQGVQAQVTEKENRRECNLHEYLMQRSLKTAIFTIPSGIDRRQRGSASFRSVASCDEIVKVALKTTRTINIDRHKKLNNYLKYMFLEEFGAGQACTKTQLIWYRLNSLYGFPDLQLTRSVSCLTQLADESLAMGCNDGRVLLWRPLEGSPPPIELTSHESRVRCIAQLTNGSIASCAAKRLSISPINGSATSVVSFDADVSSIVQLRDSRVALGFIDGFVKVLTLDTHVINTMPTPHTGAVHSIAQLADDRILSGSKQGIIIYHPDGSSHLPINYEREVTCVKLLRDGRIALGLGGSLSPHHIEVRTLDGSSRNHLIGHTGTIVSIIQLDSGYVASMSVDKSLRVWKSCACMDTYSKQQVGAYFGQLRDGRIVVGGARILKITKNDSALWLRVLHGNRLQDTPAYNK